MAHKKLHNVLFPVIMACTMGLYLVFRLQPSIDVTIEAPHAHFYIVTTVAFLAFLIAILIGLSGNRTRNIGVTLLAVAFISLAEIFMLHGMSTPGLMMGMTHVPIIASELSVCLTAFWLWMSSVSSDSPAIVFLSRWQRLIVPIWVLGLGLMSALVMVKPELMDIVPVDSAPAKWVLAFITIVMAVMAGLRYWTSFRYSRLPLQIAIVYIAGWVSIAQVIIVTGEPWHLSWWFYHFFLLIAAATMVAGVLRQYASSQSVAVAVQGLFSTNPIQRIEAGISPRVRSLIVATEARDSYTAGHNYRVALYSFRLGEAMGLAPEELRALAQGAVIHDVGKIEVPDSILNKPGKLTSDERQWIEKHPVTGYDMCKRLGFMKDELDIIRSHHEKWDGSGYPDRLAGTDIPKLARIVAIADVYDALTSERAYRQAWTHAEAMKFISEQASKHFDPDCVNAWTELNEVDPILVQYPTWASAGSLADGATVTVP